MNYHAGLSTVTLIIAKYGHDVHSYIVGTETEKKKKERKKGHRAGRQKKDPTFRKRWRVGNKCAHKHFILGGKLFDVEQLHALATR